MGRVNSEVIQAVRDAVDIVDIASSMTRLQKKGRNYEGLCPFHKEKTPSFGVDPDKGLFYCFGCGAGGDAIKLYQQHHGDEFVDAIEALAERYGIPLAEGGDDRATLAERRDRTAALDAAAAFFKRQLQSSDFARGYLDKRQVSSTLIERYEMGYAPDGWRNLLDSLGSQFAVELLLATGLVGHSERSNRPFDRFRQRLMFPIHSPSGRLLGFGGRTLGDDKAKYVNTAETEQFHKGRLLYGLNQAKRALRDGGRALLVEGYFDVIGAAACGVDWAVAGMGTALTAEQAGLLARYTDTVIVAYDGDAAGEKAFRRSLPILLGAGLGVRRAMFPEGHDPDSLRVESGNQAVIELIEEAVDGVELEIARWTTAETQRDPNARTRAATAVAELLRPIRDGIVRHGYAQSAAERLGVPLDLLMRRIARGRGPSSQPDPAGSNGPQVLPGEGPGTVVERSGEVHTLEEVVLGQLLAEEAVLPGPEELPPDEVFFDLQCRNIYAAFCALYTSGEFRSPADVIAELDREGGTLDRAARLLVQLGDSGEGNLREDLDRLLHRWYKQRQTELMRQIRQAQQHDDQARLVQLLEEKKNLSLSLHPNAEGKLW